MAEDDVHSDSRSKSLPKLAMQPRPWSPARIASCRTDGRVTLGRGQPLAVLLQVLHSVLNGTKVDLEAVKWLLRRAVNGEFPLEAAGVEDSPNIALQGVEQDVAASLAMLLGMGSMTQDPLWDSAVLRRRSSLFSIKSGSTENLLTMEEWARQPWHDLSDNSLTAWKALTASPSVSLLLTTADTWRFDAFKLDKVTAQTPLSTLGFWVMQSAGLIEEHGLDEVRLIHFLRVAEAHYPCTSSAPYHNSVHACDVLQHVYLLFKHGGLAKTLLRKEPMAQLAAYIAAVIHDLDHQGVSNDYLIKTEDRLALLYNDASPQENHHLATAFNLMKQPECDFLRSLTKEKKARFRHLVVSMVLATDMKRHMKLVTAFKNKVEAQRLADRKQLPARRVSAPGSSPERVPKPPLQAGKPLTADEGLGVVAILQMALKCADVGHTCAPWDAHLQWVRALEEEMFLQGDREAAGCMKVSPLMDRKKKGVTKSQCDFLSKVVIPLFEAWVSAFPESAPLLSNAEANLRQWKKLQSS